MENEELLDMSSDILVPSTRREDSPGTFSRHLITRLGISSSQKGGSETVSETQNMRDCMCVCVCACASVCLREGVCVCVRDCARVHVCVRVFVCARVGVYVC